MSGTLAAVARQTVEIVRNGWYLSPAGSRVSFGAEVTRSVTGTRLYLPEDELSVPAGPPATPAIEVTTESTVEAGRRVGPAAAALVFASARNPGGGFLNGARAQEEDIARSSALFACLQTVREFYLYHRGDGDLRYSDRVIYTPAVPVIRGPDGRLLEQPYGLSFLIAAAPNLGAILDRQPDAAPTVPAVLAGRAARVLRVAAAHGHRTVVLGAWGCGVFRNPPESVAAAFRTALAQVPCFDRVVFAILDRTGTGRNYRAFAEAFAAEGR